MDRPVLLIHFNRPDATRRQLEVLREVKPRNVWVVCDGPRPDREGEVGRVNEVREMLDNLPWDCRTTKLYGDENLGCCRNVSSGISWFFDQVEDGIILEDDIIPHPSFFRYCEELLDRYRDAHEVYAISGHQRCREPLPIPHDYGFANYFDCWGWATWRRAWRHYDPDITAWRDRSLWQRASKRVLNNYRARLYWHLMFKRVADGRRDSWAYRYQLSLWKEGGFCIIPKRNLCKNNGFNSQGTQTAGLKGLEVECVEQSFPLDCPEKIELEPAIDQWFEDHIHSKSPAVRLGWLLRKLKRVA